MELNKENIIKELKTIGIDNITSITFGRDFGINYATVITKDNKEYTVYENYDDAMRMAMENVKMDLEENIEFFNKDWLRYMFLYKIEKEDVGMTIEDIIASECVRTDGISPFLNSYDGSYNETKNGFVVIRTD